MGPKTEYRLAKYHFYISYTVKVRFYIFQFIIFQFLSSAFLGFTLKTPV